MIDKAYIRFRELVPDNPNTYAAYDGFRQLGAKVEPFYEFDDVATLTDLGPDVIVCGNVGDVCAALRRSGKPVPDPIDYPTHLKWLLGREISSTTFGAVRSSRQRIFVKPVAQKLFTGFVWGPGNPISRLNTATIHDDEKCWWADVVEFVSEWRCYVKHDALVACKHYKGDWTYTPSADRLGIAITQGSGIMPAAYSLDLGVTKSGKTLLVEANDGYALGSVGLSSVVYARFLEARWKELTR